MLDFQAIKNKIKELHAETLRCDQDRMLEVVFSKDYIGEAAECLDAIFGSAVFPSKSGLPRQISRDIDDFGGIMPGQTLYYSKNADGIIFAMLWPWRDGVHTTLKVIRK